MNEYEKKVIEKAREVTTAEDADGFLVSLVKAVREMEEAERLSLSSFTLGDMIASGLTRDEIARLVKGGAGAEEIRMAMAAAQCQRGR